MILPPATIGMLGGGQLGRMSAIAARQMGYATWVLEPEAHCPASSVAENLLAAEYTDEKALLELASHCQVVTLEFENIPTYALDFITQKGAVHPSANVLKICQNREREKNFLKQNGFPCAPFAVVNNAEELTLAVQRLGTPCVLKSSDFGYDGKGQIKIHQGDNLEEVWQKFGYPRGVLEGWIHYQMECSVICARNQRGEVSTFPVAENIHTNHILDISIMPARLSEPLQKQARELALALCEKLEVIGLLAVEMFVTEDDKILVNEMAPRPHNSGHGTLDACLTSQFEQHVRAVCNLPLGDTRLLTPVAMLNVLGDAWLSQPSGQPRWDKVLALPQTKLHLYNKLEAKEGRKMAHINITANSPEEAFHTAKLLKADLLSSN